MDVVIAGGHGKIALRLTRLLSGRGDRVRSLVRNPDHSGDVEDAGGEPVVCDLEREDDVSPHLEGADAAVFAAGAGPGSGAERKKTVDLGGAVKLIEACEKAGVRRYVMVSSIGAHDPASGPEEMRPYLEAKAGADRRLTESDLDWTIVRPGMLTDDEGDGRIAATTEHVRREVPRDDVAVTLAAVLDEPGTVGKTFVVVDGDTPADEAVRSV